MQPPTANEAGKLLLITPFLCIKGAIGPPEAALQETSRVPCPPFIRASPSAGLFSQRLLTNPMPPRTETSAGVIGLLKLIN